jgi:hypothetical protein
VDSIPAFIQESFFRSRRITDVVQCIGNSLHLDIFNHSNVLAIHTQGPHKQVVMQQCSCSVSTSILGIPLPDCPNCKNNRFVIAKVHGGGLSIECISWDVRVLHMPLPKTLLCPKIQPGFMSALPYPLLYTDAQNLKFEWPNYKIATPKSKSNPGKQKGTDTRGFLYGMVDHNLLLCCQI